MHLSRIWRRSLSNASLSSQITLLLSRHSKLQNELSQSAPHSVQKLKEMSIELAQLEPKVSAIQDLQLKQSTLQDLSELIDLGKESKDKDSIELAAIAREEHTQLLHQISSLENDLIRQLLPRAAQDDKSCIIEIRAGIGGDEACLFANDLLRMYRKFSVLNNWTFEVLSLSTTSLGGCKECVSLVKGNGAFGRLKFESGVHRVQRVPVNDVRVHTSAVTVVVLPEIELLDIKLNPKDIRVDVYRASGAGGQHVNTTESAVRVTHIPTGIQAAVQDERSQHQNKNKAMKILLARVYDGMRREKDSERHAMRSVLGGSGDRSERVRTYNFAQNRVSDHRVKKNVVGMDRFLNGETVDEIIDALVMQEQNERLEEMQEDC